MGRLFNDAATEYLEVASTPITAVPLTMACWFNTDDLGISEVLMSLADVGTTATWFSLSLEGAVAGDPIRAWARAAGGVAFGETSTGPAINTWHHACGVFRTNTDRSAFLDGGGEGNNTDDRTPASIDTFSIGRFGDGSPSAYFSGRVAECGLWDIALTNGEVFKLGPMRNSPTLVRPKHLIWYRSFRLPDFNYDLPHLRRAGRLDNRFRLTNNGSTFSAHPPGIVYPRDRLVVPTEQVIVGGTILPQVMQHGLYAGSAA